jgi:hypothetical protein
VSGAVTDEDLDALEAVTALQPRAWAVKVAERVNLGRPWYRRRRFGSVHRSLKRLEAAGLAENMGIPSPGERPPRA